MINKKTLIVSFTIITTLLVGAFLITPLKKAPHLSLNENNQEENNSAEVISKNITLQELAPQKIKGWKLKSKLAHFFKNKNEILCNDININLITNQNQIANLTSETTTVNIKTKNVYLEGNVSGDFSDFKLLGKNFLYEFDKHFLESKERLYLNHPQMKISAQNTKLDLKTKKITLTGDIKSTFIINNQPTNIHGKQQPPSTT